MKAKNRDVPPEELPIVGGSSPDLLNPRLGPWEKIRIWWKSQSRWEKVEWVLVALFGVMTAALLFVTYIQGERTRALLESVQ